MMTTVPTVRVWHPEFTRWDRALQRVAAAAQLVGYVTTPNVCAFALHPPLTAADRPITRETPLLWLPSGGQRYLIGLLAQTATVGWVLGITTYFGPTHADLERIIAANYGTPTSTPWGGELSIVNPYSAESLGVLRAMNETSGHLAEQRRTSDARALRQRLAVVSPIFCTPDFTAHRFDPHAQHLDADCNALGDNVRHWFGNKHMALRMIVLTEEKKPGTLHSFLVQFPQLSAGMRIVCALIAREAPTHAARLNDFLLSLDRLQTDPVTQATDVRQIATTLAWINARLQDSALTDNGAEYDLYLLGK